MLHDPDRQHDAIADVLGDAVAGLGGVDPDAYEADALEHPEFEPAVVRDLSPIDIDGDGLPDGFLEIESHLVDTDGDGVADALRVVETVFLDVTGDHVPDAIASTETTILDTDHDGSPDRFQVHASALLDVDHDGRPEEVADEDAEGLLA